MEKKKTKVFSIWSTYFPLNSKNDDCRVPTYFRAHICVGVGVKKERERVHV